MKPYLLFAGRKDTDLKGVHGLVGDFGSFAEAFVSLVDQQTACDWWHILDTKTGEVVERQHLRVNNGVIGFERSHWVAGQTAQEKSITVPAPASQTPAPKLPDLGSVEADLRSVIVGEVKKGHTNGKANGNTNGATTDH